MASDARVEEMAVRGRQLQLLNLGVSYLQAMPFTSMKGVRLRVHSVEGRVREVSGHLAFSSPLDGPACVSVTKEEAGSIAVGARVELVISRVEPEGGK